MSEMTICCEIHQNILQQNKQRKVTKPIIKLIKTKHRKWQPELCFLFSFSYAEKNLGDTMKESDTKAKM